ncbi:uncharacterized protein LOC119167669 isoform X3 [Rhipicephalus microplus]|uniref:uncharacterized protein LOC119167669 isoform X3 n=1 Tax=Rhipicephalus microplus TaxID=6941 RepID=UPI003F6D2815
MVVRRKHHLTMTPLASHVCWMTVTAWRETIQKTRCKLRFFCVLRFVLDASKLARLLREVAWISSVDVGSDFISDEDEDFSPGDLKVRKRASPVRLCKYKYKCSLCPKVFGTARDMGIHVRRHEGVKPYTCKDCNKAFCTPFELDQHVRTHTGERPFKCPTCACAFATLSTLLRHSNTHRRSNSVMYRCSVCPSLFRYAVTCAAHERTHRADCTHRCKTCNRVFPRAFNLKRHMRLHDSDEPHVCNMCDRSFNKKEHLNMHLQSCGKFRKCETCGKGFLEEAQLEAHIASQHDLATESLEEARLGDLLFEQAPADDESSSEDGSGSNDLLSADQMTTNSGWSVRLRVRGKTNAPKAPARRHQHDLRYGIVPSQNLQCSSTRSLPQKHVTGECGTDEASKSPGKAADGTQDTSIPIYQCPSCNDRFKEWAALKAHAAVRHELVLSSSSFQFACHICDKTFRQNSNLKTHLKSHDRVVQFECDICGMGFTLKHHYRRHRSNIHYKD